MNAHLRRPSRETGGGIQWIVILIALVSLAIVFFITRKPDNRKAVPPDLAVRPADETATITPLTSAPEPKAPPTATPAPAVVEAPPPPTPLVEAKPPPLPLPATPAATPALDLATVAVSPTLWPPKVALLQPFSFPILLSGRVVGQAQAPVGTLMRLVRIDGQQVEIEFQNVRHMIPAASTDLLQRALQKLHSGDSGSPSLSPSVTATTPPASSPLTPASQTSATVGGAALGQRIAIEPVPKLVTQKAGGYYDKRDEFELKLKFKSSDGKNTAENLKAEIYIIGESLADPNILRVLAHEDFTFSLPPHGGHEVKTKEVKTTYYNSGSYRSGVKYWCWFVRIRDNAGGLVKVKSSSPALEKLADKIAGLTVDGYYDKKTLKETASVN